MRVSQRAYPAVPNPVSGARRGGSSHVAYVSAETTAPYQHATKLIYLRRGLYIQGSHGWHP